MSGSEWLAYSQDVLSRLPTPAVLDKSLCSVTPAFKVFLAQKAAVNFWMTDKLKYRCITFINAEGFSEHVKAIWQMGFLGWVYYGEVSDLSLRKQQTLDHELQFYQKCRRVKKLYRQCTHRDCYATAATIQKFQEAYEAVLAYARGNAAQHDQINTILNKYCAKGASIGTAVVERMMVGKFNTDGLTVLDEMRALYAAGYRCGMSCDQQAVVTKLVQTIITNREIKEVLESSHLAPIFVACGRACNQISNRAIPDQQAEKAMDRDNQLILKMIQGKSPMRSLLACPIEELARMRTIYAQYQADLAELAHCEKEFSSRIQKSQEITDNYAKLTNTYTLDELAQIIHPDSQLEVVQEIQQRLKHQKRVRLQLEKQEQLIEQVQAWQIKEMDRLITAQDDQQLEEVMAELQRFEPTSTNKHGLVVAKDKMMEKLAHISRVALTDEQVAAIYNESQKFDRDAGKRVELACSDLVGQMERCASEMEIITNDQDRIQKRVDAGLRALHGLGFKVNKNGDLTDEGFHYHKLELSQYQKRLQAEVDLLSANIMNTLRAVTFSMDQLERAQSALPSRPDISDCLSST